MSTSAFDRLAQSLLGEKNQAPTLAETVRALTIGGGGSEVREENERLQGSMSSLPGSGMGVAGSTFVSFKTLRRDLQVGVFSQGGAAVGEDKFQMAYPLANQTIAEKCGARIITGLTGDCFLPRFTSMPVATNLAEMATAPDSTPATDQVRTRPHRLTVVCNITRQLEHLNPSISGCLADLMIKALAVAVDRSFLYGEGGSEPLGILNTPGIGSALFGGPATFGPIVDLETALTNANVECDPATTWYFATPQVKSKLKKIAKSAGITQPIWETIQGVDYVNGYRARCSNNVPNNLVGLADFSQTALCIYGDGIELQFNPYTGDTAGKTRVVAHIWIDVLVDHSQAVACSADAGNQ